ncbi:VanZ family protein [Corynebacterium mendelii]|nr:VanZ family protein [Corynebacterium mendelii]
MVHPLALGWVLACQLVCTLALTMAKSQLFIGGLWKTANQSVRQIRLVPFAEFFSPTHWYSPWINAVGNIALFAAPVFVAVLVVLCTGAGGRIRQLTAGPGRFHPYAAVAVAAGLASIVIELVQFVFALGYTDIDDVIFNAAGALAGYWLGRTAAGKPGIAAAGVAAVGLVNAVLVVVLVSGMVAVAVTG